jgi:1-acyl-sn-glycerol-3-phosphate acyltransferase
MVVGESVAHRGRRSARRRVRRRRKAKAARWIAANHVSWLDIFAISRRAPTRFIAKSEIRDWPLAGWIAERAGTIFIRRERRRDTGRISERVHAALAEGDCVGLFPEGATTEGDEMLKFHSSLFEPAVANAAHVHPCAIRYERADGPCREVAYVGELSFMQSFGLVMRQRGVVVARSRSPRRSRPPAARAARWRPRPKQRSLAFSALRRTGRGEHSPIC